MSRETHNDFQKTPTTSHTFVWERSYDVSAERLFELVADNDTYARLAPNLSGIQILSGKGVGMVRECRDSEGACWRETYTEWQPGVRFATEVDVASYPSDLKEMIVSLSASWTVTPHSARQATVRMEIESTLTDLGVQVLRDGGGADSLVVPIFDGWGQALENESM